jgi:hypothetical protein
MHIVYVGGEYMDSSFFNSASVPVVLATSAIPVLWGAVSQIRHGNNQEQASALAALVSIAHIASAYIGAKTAKLISTKISGETVTEKNSSVIKCVGAAVGFLLPALALLASTKLKVII